MGLFTYYAFINKKNNMVLHNLALPNKNKPHDNTLNEMKKYLATKKSIKSENIDYKRVY